MKLHLAGQQVAVFGSSSGIGRAIAQAFATEGCVVRGFDRIAPAAERLLVHSLGAPSWGLAIWWPFLIFSTLFVVWRQRGFWAGVAVASATHALQNLIPALVVAGYI